MTTCRTIYLHRLGCSKLDVDHDLLSAGLRERGGRFVDAADDADTVIISTCAFIGDARAEAVEAMLEGAQWRDQDFQRKLYVTGCLPARYRDTLANDLPEVDGWYGPGEFDRLLTDLDPDSPLTSDDEPGETPHPGRMNRSLSNVLGNLREVDEGVVAYLKIAEGCDRRCAYCAIPNIRGPYTSRRPGSILSETSRLLAGGAKEIIVTAQEINSYGRDLKDGTAIHHLLPRMGKLVADAGGWLRVLYTHPPLFDEEFVLALADTPALTPYLDYPVEHTDDSVLRSMGRATTWDAMKHWIDRLRETIVDIALRTSIIVGHPGEGPEEFATLIERLDDVRFERLGVFRYSPEEGTRSLRLDAPSEDEAIQREQVVQELAFEHADAWYESKIGQSCDVLVERIDEESGRSTGRTVWDAPDIDGEVELSEHVDPGTIVRGTIRAGEPYLFSFEPGDK
jgi:ribosomal protein S12 methylthiotransferase